MIVKRTLRNVGLAGLGLGVTIKEKVERVGRKLVRKGESEKKVLGHPKDRLEAGARMAGKEALVISRKSLQMLERELRKLEKEAGKAGKVAKRAVKKRLTARAKKKRR